VSQFSYFIASRRPIVNDASYYYFLQLFTTSSNGDDVTFVAVVIGVVLADIIVQVKGSSFEIARFISTF